MLLLRLCRSFTTGCWGKEGGERWGQAAGTGAQPPPYRAQGPHLGGAGQELLLLPGRCHRGDEAQRGHVLPFLLEKKRKVINSTTKGRLLPCLRAFQHCLLHLGEKSRLLSGPRGNSLISALPLFPACRAEPRLFPSASSLCPLGPLLLPLPATASTQLSVWLALHAIRILMQLVPLGGYQSSSLGSLAKQPPLLLPFHTLHSLSSWHSGPHIFSFFGIFAHSLFLENKHLAHSRCSINIWRMNELDWVGGWREN